MQRTIVSFVLLFGAAAPGLAQSRESREHTQILAELRTLHEQQQRLQLAVNQLVEALNATNAAIAAQGADTTKGFANLQAQISALASAIPQLNSLLQQTRVDMGRIGPELDALREALTTVLKYNAQIVTLLTPTDPLAVPPGAAGTDPAAPQTQAPPPVTAPPPTVPTSPTDFFKLGDNSYLTGDYATAIDAFEAFLKAAPDHPDAPFAQMQIGHSYAHLKEPQKAMAAFRAVTERYPNSQEVPDAFYYVGWMYETLKDPKNAISMYKIVTSKYPKTTADIRARERLKQISK